MRTGISRNRPFLKSMVACLTKVVNDGFKEDFKATAQGLISLLDNTVYGPEQVKLVNFFRFEDYSNPNDKAVLYLFETANGHKGTLIDTQGPEADPMVDRFIHQMETVHKRHYIQ